MSATFTCRKCRSVFTVDGSVKTDTCKKRHHTGDKLTPQTKIRCVCGEEHASRLIMSNWKP